MIVLYTLGYLFVWSLFFIAIKVIFERLFVDAPLDSAFAFVLCGVWPVTLPVFLGVSFLLNAGRLFYKVVNNIADGAVEKSKPFFEVRRRKQNVRAAKKFEHDDYYYDKDGHLDESD